MSRLGYARVSSAEQDPALQIDALTAAGCDRVWQEKVCGARAERPELAALLRYARAGDTLVVWRLDRLGRSLSHLVTLLADLQERQIGFLSLQEGMDTATSAGRLLFHVAAAMAEFERSLIRERTMAGLEAARAAGRRGGRHSTVSESGLRVAQRLLAAGEPMAVAARGAGVSRQALYRALARAEEMDGAAAAVPG